MSTEDEAPTPGQVDQVASIVAETLKRAGKRRAAQVDDTRSLEDKIASARAAGLLADEHDLAQAQALLSDAHIILWRLLGSLGEGLTEPVLGLRLRASIVPVQLRALAQGAEAVLSYAYSKAGGVDALMRDRAEHREATLELMRETCACDRCLMERAGGRESRRHPTGGA
ncbi:MAG: hypothetical protein IPK64_20005 [bacterium]|nr:hypothetical protein [bacterium]